MLFRRTRGHFNLGLSFGMLLDIYLLCTLWYQCRVGLYLHVLSGRNKQIHLTFVGPHDFLILLPFLWSFYCVAVHETLVAVSFCNPKPFV